MRKTVFISGYYGFGNTGDEMILEVLLQQLREGDPSLIFKVMSGNPASTSATHQVESVLWSDMLAMQDAVMDSDLVIIGGGGVFHDYWGFDPNLCLVDGHWGISYYTAPAALAAMHQKPLMLYGIGIGPLLSEKGREYTKVACDVADIITVRDDASKLLLSTLGVDSAKISVTADPAFAHRVDSSEGRQLRSTLQPNSNKPLAAVVVRPWQFGVSPSFWEREFALALDQLISQDQFEVLFVPFQWSVGDAENDSAIGQRVRAHMEQKNAAFTVSDPLTPRQTFALLSECDLVVGMRLHAAVAAALGNVPLVAISYDPKVDQTLSRLGLEEFTMPLTEIDTGKLVELMRKAVSQSEDFRRSIGENLAVLRQLAQENSTLAQRLLRGLNSQQRNLTPELAELISRSVRRHLELLRGFRIGEQSLFGKIESLRLEATQSKTALEQGKQNFIAQVADLQLKASESEAVLGSKVSELETALELKVAELESTLEMEKREAEARFFLLQSDLDRLALELQKSKDQNRNLERERQSAEQQLDAEKSAFYQYKNDKELYIAGLIHDLARARRTGIQLLISGFASIGRFSIGLIWRLLPTAVQKFWEEFRADLLVMRPATPAKIIESISEQPSSEPVKVSLIATVLNEGKTLGVWFQSVEKQTRQPDELIIVDAGSTDDTVEQIRRFEQASKFPVKLQVSPGANIAKGRNIAIEMAAHEVIACSDAGCLLHPMWLEQITNPFETVPETSVVAGWTESLVKTEFHKAFSELFVPRVNQVDFNRYLPSSRTIAFTKSAWRAAGKYPEWLTLCAEDTFFAIRMRNESRGWVVAPEAIVYWQGRNSWKGVFKQAYGYGFGDGEAGLHSAMYRADLLVLIRLCVYLAIAVALLGLSTLLPLARPWGGPGIVILLGLVMTVRKVRLLNRIYNGQQKAPLSHCLRKAGLLYAILIARTVGFARGVQNRRVVAQRRYADLSGCAVIFSGVPIDDSGGGQRATQLALELLNQNYRVIFLHYYPRYETVDLKIRITHANLEAYSLKEFDVAQFLRTRRKGQPAFAIAEFPHPSFVDPLRQLRSDGVKVIYDLIDDWRTSLGGDWYSLSVEKEYLSFCDYFIASAETLASRLRSMGAEHVELVPNAVNRHIFTWRNHERPQDMPQGKYTIIYVGALWGHWFDWDLLIGVARAHPQAAVIVIGDYHGQCPESLPNLHFLGLKAQRDLPPYLANANVAIIPFKNSGLTQAVSPLKVFEYLSMKLPVVSTPLREVESLPYVITASTMEEFVKGIDSALSITITSQEVDEFVRNNSWSARLEQILKRVSQR